MSFHKVVCMIVCCLCHIDAVAENSLSERGRGQDIYLGKEVIIGKIDGHASSLPPSLGICVTCHASAKRSRLEAELAPRLNRSSLLDPRSRRGGPGFSYDKTNFCKTVRTGIDPQYIVLRRAMPRFEISESQCSALWAYLTNEQRNEKP
jgi:hypothetical protein